MNTIQIATICIAIAAIALNAVNFARARKRYKDAEAKINELERKISNAKWDC